MLVTSKILTTNLEQIEVSHYWSNDTSLEIKMHKIHSYAAKFPSFVVKKSIELAQDRNISLKTVADIFCGCGTTALEAKTLNLNFWGCDINPVATLIAKVKSEYYDDDLLNRYYRKIGDKVKYAKVEELDFISLNERINYWFEPSQTKDLHYLLKSINNEVPQGKYRDFFLCAFSNILKSTSRWLTKSIKPQVDPNKKPHQVFFAFENQFNFMKKANIETSNRKTSESIINIHNQNFLEVEDNTPFADMLITSPPYVTSYEYADLHQLSTLWLGYTEDYKSLRKGTIGSLFFNEFPLDEVNSINDVGLMIYNNLFKVDKSKANSVAKYFIDMNKIIHKAFQIINKKGMAVFVIGNTKYKDVEVDNAKYLLLCMLDKGFDEIEIYKRKIGNKILTPFRDGKGKFSKNSTDRKVYSHEYVIIARKP